MILKIYVLPSISELQPRRVSWSDNIIGVVSKERRLKLSFPSGRHRSSFDDRKNLDTIWVVIIYMATLLEDEPIGDSTPQFWLSLGGILREILRSHKLTQYLTLKESSKKERCCKNEHQIQVVLNNILYLFKKIL